MDIVDRTANLLVDDYKRSLARKTLFDKDYAVYYINLIIDLLKTNGLDSKIVDAAAKIIAAAK